MFSRISSIPSLATSALLDGCSRVHAAGIDPNTMNRFLLSNLQEVLFVN
jgi:hypothetical protein